MGMAEAFSSPQGSDFKVAYEENRVLISIGSDLTKTSVRKKFNLAVYTIRRQKGISNLVDVYTLKLSLGHDPN